MSGRWLNSVGLMYEKPKYRKKTRHKSNDRVKPGTFCWFECGKLATEKHELKGGAGFRTSSIEAEFNVETCRKCHDLWDDLPKKVKRAIRQVRQREVMQKNKWTIEEFREAVGISYIKEGE